MDKIETKIKREMGKMDVRKTKKYERTKTTVCGENRRGKSVGKIE